jgi:tRNA threonylcarbamoyladenosine biosynthesis protein TsaB
MLILTLRTDKPEAELGLYMDDERLAYDIWEAHRQLAETIHTKIKELLDSNGKQISDLEAIACYQGPGSFTGLRIGLSVANALAYSLEIPIAGAVGEDWLSTSLLALKDGKGQKVITPEYGSPVNITQPRR